MKTIRIYSDESRHRGERFLLLGGLWIEETKVGAVEKRLNQLRNKHSYTNDKGRKILFAGELKWTKVSTKYYNVYKDLVDIFFDSIAKDDFRFCCLLLDTQLPEVIQYANIKKEGYFKILYQLYYHNSKTPAIYKIFPDKISNPAKRFNLPRLQSVLDGALHRKFRPMMNPAEFSQVDDFVQCVTPVDSKKEQIIQLVDVVLGAIGYFQNRHFKKQGAKKAKVALMKYVLDKMILSGAMHFTGKEFITAKSTRFNIWIFKPKKNQKWVKV